MSSATYLRSVQLKDKMGFFSELFEYQYKPFKDMTREELEEELDTYRKLWTWVEESVKAWLTHIRYPVNLVRRDYKILNGLLGQPHFEIKSVDVDVVEEIFNYSKGILTYETKTITIPVSQLVDFEFIHNKEVMPMPKPEAMTSDLEALRVD